MKTPYCPMCGCEIKLGETVIVVDKGKYKVRRFKYSKRLLPMTHSECFSEYTGLFKERGGKNK